MEAQQFCYWLQGFAELNNGIPPNDMQWKAIRDHLATVFEKKTPNYSFTMPRTPVEQPSPFLTPPGVMPLTYPTVVCSTENQNMSTC